MGENPIVTIAIMEALMARRAGPRAVMSLTLCGFLLSAVGACSREAPPAALGAAEPGVAASGVQASRETRQTGDQPSNAPMSGEWRLIAIDRTRLSEGGAPTIAFGEEGKCGGSTGVNEFRTTFSFEGLKHNRFKVGNAAVTRKMGPPEAMALEKLFLDRLESAKSYEVSSDLLYLHSGENQNLTFERVYP